MDWASRISHKTLSLWRRKRDQQRRSKWKKLLSMRVTKFKEMNKANLGKLSTLQKKRTSMRRKLLSQMKK